jgi:DNA modification methylase
MLELNKVHLGDCLELLKQLPDESVDSVVTDPPAGISFMGKSWDTFDKDMFGIKGEEGENDLKIKKNFNILPRYANSDLIGFQDFICQVFTEIYRVLKSGGHCLVWAIPRTSHHTAMGLERAGFEIRDCVYHVFGTGFPKSMNVGIAIDKLQGNEREVISQQIRKGRSSGIMGKETEIIHTKDKGNSEFEGWGTALKPAVECWWLIRKPLSEKSIAENVLKHKTGGINIDACRINFVNDSDLKESTIKNQHKDFNSNNGIRVPTNGIYYGDNRPPENYNPVNGRFPSNFIHDGSDEVLKQFPDVEDEQINDKSVQQTLFGDIIEKKLINSSRFFYCAKASKEEKNRGCEQLQEKYLDDAREIGSAGGTNPRNRGAEKPMKNFHPTVKSLELMEYLVKLITPPNGVVLEPFAGSGSTCVACKQLQFNFIGFEKDPEYVKICEARLNAVAEKLNRWF